MPADRNRHHDLDDITGRRQSIKSPRDAQTGLPSVHEGDAGEVGDVDPSGVSSFRPSPSGDGTIVHHFAGAGRGQDIEVENDETHVELGDTGTHEVGHVFDDTDIVHVLGGDSIYANNPGGGLLGVVDDAASSQPVGIEVEGLDDLNL